MKSIVLITKDILMTNYLPAYGNKHWETPNIDALSKKGTIFNRHYTAAPSTAMSFLAMCTGKYPYEFKRKKYQHEPKYKGYTIFKKARELGYESHLIWSDNYMYAALPYANCFDDVSIHHFDFNQPVGPHLKNIEELERDDSKSNRVMKHLFDLLSSLPSENVFIWIHLPHVILGRTGYGMDIDLLDELVGFCRVRYGDESIYVSADHGNMNCQKNITGYGFHLYESAVHIPLITPRIEQMETVDFPTSNIQLQEIIFDQHIRRNDFVISETTYRLQPNRKTAIIHGDFKFIHDKLNNIDELYDVVFDPNENRNLLNDKIWDSERNRYNNIQEVYYYPNYEIIEEEAGYLKQIFNSIKFEGKRSAETIERIKYKLAKKIMPMLYFFRIKKKKKKVVRKS